MTTNNKQTLQNSNKGVKDYKLHSINNTSIVAKQFQELQQQKELEKQEKLQQQKELQEKDKTTKNVYYKQLATDYIQDNNKNVSSIYILAKSQVTRTLARFQKISDYGDKLYKASRKHLQDSTQIEKLHTDIQDLIQNGIKYMQNYIYTCKQENIQPDTNNLIKIGYQGINKHLISSQGLSIKLGAYNFSLEKMLENGCDLTIKQGIASIFNQNKYNYIPLEIDFTPTQKLMLQAIKSVLQTQSLYTNRILYFYCLGDSYRQVATRFNRSVSAIQFQIEKVKKLCLEKYNEYITNNK